MDQMHLKNSRNSQNIKTKEALIGCMLLLITNRYPGGKVNQNLSEK